MALPDTEVQKQINHMMAFIDQEANEKAEEIDAKSEEEFNIEKARLVQSQRQKISDYYDRKEKQIELQKKIQNSNLLNQARLRVLKEQEDHIRTMLDEGKVRLGQITKDEKAYKKMLVGLLSQGFFQMLEENVVVRCKKSDEGIVKDSILESIKNYKEATKRDVTVTLDNENYLSEQTSGGVEILAQRGRIRIVNTLESRLEMIARQMLPELRNILYGVNPNRKFLD